MKAIIRRSCKKHGMTELPTEFDAALKHGTELTEFKRYYMQQLWLLQRPWCSTPW